MTKSCEERIKERYQDRINDLKTLTEAEDNKTEELGSLYDYGLCIDLVEAETFEGQKEPYIRYQLSWGGPSDEFRLYQDGKLEYWFMDWFDGASREVDAEDEFMIKEIIELSGVTFEN